MGKILVLIWFSKKEREKRYCLDFNFWKHCSQHSENFLYQLALYLCLSRDQVLYFCKRRIFILAPERKIHSFIANLCLFKFDTFHPKFQRHVTMRHNHLKLKKCQWNPRLRKSVEETFLKNVNTCRAIFILHTGRNLKVGEWKSVTLAHY